MPSLDRDGEVFVLDLGDTENRFHPDWLAAVQEHLTTVEAADGPRALVTTATGKFFSNGLDLDWLSQNGERFVDYVIDVHALLGAGPGDAGADGGRGARSCVRRRRDARARPRLPGDARRPRVLLPARGRHQHPVHARMAGLIQGRLSKKTAHEAMTTGRRYGGTDALTAGIVDAVAHEDDVLLVGDRAGPPARRQGRSDARHDQGPACTPTRSPRCATPITRSTDRVRPGRRGDADDVSTSSSDTSCSGSS